MAEPRSQNLGRLPGCATLRVFFRGGARIAVREGDSLGQTCSPQGFACETRASRLVRSSATVWQKTNFQFPTLCLGGLNLSRAACCEECMQHLNRSPRRFVLGTLGMVACGLTGLAARAGDAPKKEHP